MATPINNLPLRTQISTDEQKDIQDPMVQDVLKEFQEELNASNRIQQQQVQQSPQYNIIHQQPINNVLSSSHVSSNNIYKFDIDIAKKTLIIVLIVGLLSYNSNLLFSLYSKLPEKIDEYFKSYDNIVKLFILFIIYYLLFFYKVL